jgi:hypothetical protein
VVQVKVNVEEFAKLVDAIAPRVFRNMRAAMTFIAEKHQKTLVNHHRGIPGGGLVPRKPKGAPLSRISGRLMDSAGYTVTPPDTERGRAPIGELRLNRFIGRGIKYARMHEDGKEIGPVRHTMLTVPTMFARTQAGDQRASIWKFQGRWSKRIPGKARWFFQTGTGLPLFKGIGPGLDQETVKIPARLGFVDMFKAQKTGQQRIFELAISRGLKGQPLTGGGA